MSNANILLEGPRGYDIVRIEDKLMTDNRELFLNEEVTAVSCNELIKQLWYLDKKEPGKEITLYINSPGGSVHDGLAVYDVIGLLDSPVKTVVTGSACSMGAILFLAGDTRLMLNHSRVMIHDASFGSADFSGLKPDAISEKAADLLETTKLLRNIVSERTGQSMSAVTKKMKKDSFFNASEALEFGFATGIVKKGDR